MKIQIKDKDIELKYSFRAMMLYEEITKETFNLRGMKDLIVYLYSTIIASDKDLDLDFEAFMDWLDSNPEVLTQFGEWVVNHGKKNEPFRTQNENTEDGSELKKNNK